MKKLTNYSLKKLLTTMACVALASSAAANAQTLIDFTIASSGGTGQAVLGGTNDTYNNFGAAQFTEAAATAGETLVANAVNTSGATTGVAISTSTGFNAYNTPNGGSPNPHFLMDGYGYTATGSQTALNGPLNITFSGLTAYDGDTFTLEVYGAGNNAGNGDAIALSASSTATGFTSGTDRNITNGSGDAYQTFTGTVSGDVLSFTGTPNPNTASNGYTEVNGAQLELTAAAPEPSAWAMMIGGLGLLFGIARFRRQVQV